MRVLALSRYARLAGGTRVRFYQYFDYLRAHSVDVVVAPLLGDDYVAALAERRGPGFWNVVRAYARRIGRLTRTSDYDLVWLQCEALPWVPEALEGWLMPSRIPYVVDYDDAWFHRYDRHARASVRRFLGGKIDGIMARAATVIAGNDYLAARAKLAGARDVQLLPSAVDLERYPLCVPSQTPRFTIGWIGSPTTAPYLNSIADALRMASERLDARVVLVGSGTIDLPGLSVETRSWQEASEADEISNFDVGIMPLTDGPWEQGKCGFKLIQYMAAGRPAIASPVGANRVIVRHGTTGFLATTTDDWMRSFEALAASEDLRTRMGLAGRQVVEREYSTTVVAPRLLETLIRATRPVET